MQTSKKDIEINTTGTGDNLPIPASHSSNTCVIGYILNYSLDCPYILHIIFHNSYPTGQKPALPESSVPPYSGTAPSNDGSTTLSPFSGDTMAPLLAPGISLPPVAIPVTEVPSLSAPISAPGITVPPVAIPATEVPSLSAPISAPGITPGTVPPVAVPVTEVPSLSAPISAPIAVPVTEVPSLSAPISAPGITVPPVAVPVTEVPSLSAPISAPVAIPATEVPSLSAPISAPVAPPVDGSVDTIAPTPVSTSLKDLIAAAAPDGGAGFADANSYQSKALAFVEGVTPTSVDRILQFYALACVWYATSAVANAVTISESFTPVPWMTSTNWVTDTDFCTWFGITCIGENVSELELISNGLSGSLPAEVSMLDGTLIIIDLFDNYYLYNDGAAGNDFLGDIPSLKYLYFGSTSFSYAGIPPSLAKLTNLVEFDCSFTLYIGPIPDIFAPLVNLNYLDMGDQDWQGSPVPSSLIALPNLEYFYFDNTFNDDTLDFFLGMPKIIEFWADNNAWNTTIPSGIGAKTTLKSLSLSFSGLTGTIPAELGSLTLMETLWLYQNKLTGLIPSQLGMLTNISELNLEGNMLTGTMPASVCSLTPSVLGADCATVTCSCCTCCDANSCGDFAV